jgi:fatty acid desaturase
MATFFNGLSYSYFFKHNHMRHHAHCGEETVDPEMQSDIFGFYEDAARTKRGLCRHTSRYQAGLIWVMVTLNGFSVRNEGIKFMWRNPRATRIDRLAAFLHFVMWLIVPIYFLGLWHAILNYFIFTWLIGVYLMGIILFYHVGCRVIRSDETISAFRRQVEGTRNMGTSWLVELYAAGTNNHIEHHLFPDIPTARLRRARDITRAFCNRHAIEYKEMGYRSAVRDVTRHMSALSRHVPSVVRQ